MHNFNVVNKGEYKHKQTSGALHVSRFLILRGKHCRYLLLDFNNKKEGVLTGVGLQIDQFDARGNALGTVDVSFSNLNAKSGKFILKEKIKLHHACTDFFVKVVYAEYGDYKFRLGKSGEYSVYDKKEIITPVPRNSVKKETGKTGFSWARRVFSKPAFVCFFSIIIMLAVVGATYFQLQNFMQGRDRFVLSNVEYQMVEGNDGAVEVEVIGYQGWGGGNLVIPKTVNGYPVVRVVANAFQDNGLVKSLKTEGEIIIEQNAFNNCINLREVQLLDKTVVNDYAFENCINLKNVVIGASNYIGYKAFKNCESLKTVSLPSDLESIGDSAFENCKSLTGLTLADNIQFIGRNLLRGCYSIKNISVPFFGMREGENLTAGYLFGLSNYVYQEDENNIPYTLEEITLSKQTELKQGTFYGLKGLKKVNLAKITSIEKDVFVNCHRLRSFEIPSTVVSFTEEAFKNNYKLFEIKNYSKNASISVGIGAGEYALKVYSYGDELLEREKINDCIFVQDDMGKWHLTDAPEGGVVNLPENVQGESFSIPDYFFLRFNAESVIVNGDTDRIGDYAFNNTYIRNISFKGGAHTLGQEVFANNKYLVSLDLYDSAIESVPVNTLVGNSVLENLAFSATTTFIAENNLVGCLQLKKVSLSPLLEKIDDSFFAGFNQLEQVKFNGNEVITTIGNKAFENCVKLKDIVLPDSITDIGDNAFYNCVWLPKMVLPYKLENLGAYAFYNCQSIREITIEERLKNIDNYAFSSSGLKELYIPETVERIGYGALQDCGSLQKLTVPFIGETKLSDSVFGYFFGVDNTYGYNSSFTGSLVVLNENTLVESVFKNFNCIKSIDLIGDIYSIPNRAFENCSELKSVSYPYSVTSIGSYAFAYDYNLANIELTNRVASIGESAFVNCGSLLAISFPNSLNYLGDYAFSSCGSLRSVSFGYGLNTINDYAFAWCNSLTNIEFSDSIQNIGNYAFFNCVSLVTVSFPFSIRTVGNNSFEHCSSLRNVNFDSNADVIGDYAFSNCNSLTNVELSNNTQSIGEYAFSNCASLKSIDLPRELYTLGNYAFSSCYTLQDVSFENVAFLSTISAGAFQSCSSLKSIELPYSVTTIEDSAFSNCASLANLDLKSVENIGAWAFSSCNFLKELNLPSSINSIGMYAFQSNTALEVVYLRSNAYIYSDAFSNCRNLHEVYDLSGYNKITVGSSDNGGLGYYAVIVRKSVLSPRLKVYEVNSIKYKYAEDFCALIKCDSNLSQIVLDYVVINGNRYSYVIATNAFENCYVNSITIKDGVSDIKRYAFPNYIEVVKFEGCYLNLYNINDAFSGANYVVFDSNLRGLGSRTFSYVSYLLYTGSEAQWNYNSNRYNFYTYPTRYYAECFHNWNDENWNYDDLNNININYQWYKEKDRIEPTCTKDGSYVEYCDVCGHNQKIILDKYGHDYYYEYYHVCGVCKEVNPFTFDSSTRFNSSQVMNVKNNSEYSFSMFSESFDEIVARDVPENESSVITFTAVVDIKISLDVMLGISEKDSAKIIVSINGKEKTTIDENGKETLTYTLKKGESLKITFQRGEVEEDNCFASIKNIKIS